MPVLTVQQQQFSIEGILFDKDGTLLEFFLRLWGVWGKLMSDQVCNRVAALGGDISGEFRGKLLGTQYDSLGQLAGYDLQGPLSIASIPEVEGILAWQLYKHGLPWNESLTVIRGFRDKANEEIERTRPAVPTPGLLPFLEQCVLSRIPLCVVTADDTAEARKHLTWMNALHYFQDVIGDDQVTEGKPDPEMVRLACERLGIEPREWP